MTKPLSLTLAALACASALPSCSSTSDTDGAGLGDGRTLFLGDFRKKKEPTDADVAEKVEVKEAPEADNSWWRGDDYVGSPSVTIDLSDQIAYFYKGGELVGQSAVSTGKSTHRTPTGSFKITQKNADHASNLYGKIVDSNGNVVVAEADSRKDKVPSGGKYIGAPMPNFMRFNGGVGMHAGYLPGYPASHGCVRMPEYMSAHFFNHVNYGTPVKVVP